MNLDLMDGPYVTNLDEYADVDTHWIALYVKNTEIIYLTALGLRMFLKKLKNQFGLKT